MREIDARRGRGWHHGGMFRVPLGVSVAVALLAVVMIVSNFSEHSSASDGVAARAEHETAELLGGTWLREYTDGGAQVRRVLRLQGGGTFRESVRAVEPGGQVTRLEHEGQWLYDGTNLKRKYTLVDGRPPSRLRPPFATFEVSFASRDEFTGVDHVHRRRVHYRRVADDAAP